MRLGNQWMATGAVAWRFLASAEAGADDRLIEAVKNQDRDTVRALLAEPVDVNTTEGEGATALPWAVVGDDADVVAGLLHAGAGWPRDRFTDIGVIQFEDWVDTGEEYADLDEVAKDRAATSA